MRPINQSLLLLSFVVGACAAPPQPPALPQTQVPFDASRPGGETPSTSSSERSLAAFTAGKGLSVPSRPDTIDPVTVGVRPDAFRVRFAVRAIRPSASEALQVVQRTSTLITDSFHEELRAPTAFRGSSVTEIVQEQKVLGIAVTTDAMVDVPVAEGLDFWQRNELHVKIVELTKRLAAEANVDRTVAVSFRAPSAIATNPEAYRANLIRRWVRRAQEFAAAAGSAQAPLALVDCEVPTTVEQYQVSVSEVELSLRLRCRIDRPGTPPSSPSPAPSAGDDELQ